MGNLAEKHDAAATCLEQGTVAEIRGEEYVVETDWGAAHCRRAAGCLLKPETGDTVLASIGGRGSYVLSVLERSGAAAPAVDLEPGTVIRSENGDLDLFAAGKLACGAAELEVRAVRASAAAETASVTGGLFSVRARSIRTMAEQVETVARDLTQRLASMFRHTKEHEECQAGSKRQLVEETFAVQSKNAVVVADEDVRLDGELIHMG